MTDKHDERAPNGAPLLNLCKTRKYAADFFGNPGTTNERELARLLLLACGEIETNRSALRQVERETLERAAKVCEKRFEDRFNEYGIRDWDTNACYYAGRDAAELEAMDQEDEDCAAAIRALIESEKVQEGE